MFFRCAPFWRKNRGVYPFLAKPQKLILLLYCFMDPFPPSDLCLYKCKESSVHGTISSVVCQNIISSVLLYGGHVFPRLMSVQV